MRLLPLLRVATLTTLTALASPLAASIAHAQVLETIRVAMPDGTELATDVWRPVIDDGPRPVVLRRTPYGRAFDMGGITGFSSLGYIFVSQDVRGRGDSDGSFSPFRDDAVDGAATIAWIADQPWSNGRVGTVGGSAEGIVQLMAAGEAPPALECAHVLVATDDVYEGIAPGGAWRDELTNDWLTGLGEPAALADFRAHEAGDAYWDPARIDESERARIDASLFLVGGVYDIFAVGTPRTFRSARESAPAADRTFMVLGPWTHGGVNGTTQGELVYPPDAAYEAYVDEIVAYFGWCLKDEPRPAWSPARYYVSELGDDGVSATGEWRDGDAWPPPTTAVVVHLHVDGALSASAPTESDASVALAVDPASPVPSVGGGNLSTAAGPHDQSAVDARDDVFVATTVPMTEPVELIGDVHARIVAASASTDVDVIVRLEVLTPSGHAMLVADGVRRGRYTSRIDAITPLTPGTPATFDVDVGPVALRLPPGYAIRVALSGTSSPRYEPNPNVADPIATATPVATMLTVYADATHDSTVTFPLASGRWPEAVDPPELDAGVRDASTLDAATGTDPEGGGCGSCAVGPDSGATPTVVLFGLGAWIAVRARARRRRCRSPSLRGAHARRSRS